MKVEESMADIDSPRSRLQSARSIHTQEMEPRTKAEPGGSITGSRVIHTRQTDGRTDGQTDGRLH